MPGGRGACIPFLFPHKKKKREMEKMYTWVATETATEACQRDALLAVGSAFSKPAQSQSLSRSFFSRGSSEPQDVVTMLTDPCLRHSLRLCAGVHATGAQ